MSRLLYVGTGERLQLAQTELSRAKGRTPDGIVLLDGAGNIVLLNAGASRLLDLDPRRALGKPIGSQLNDFDGAQEFVWNDLEVVLLEIDGEGYVGVFDPHRPRQDAEFDVPLSVGAFVEAMLSRDSVEDLMLWLGDRLGLASRGNRGAIALRDEEWMVLWSAWPEDKGTLMPLRFAAMESKAFRTGMRSLGNDFELTAGEQVSVVPVIVDGSVMALVAYEGNQPDVEEILPHLGLALRRFVD